MLFFILGQCFFIVLTTAATENENIFCSNIKPVENVNLQQLEGKWLAFEMYNGTVNGAKALIEMCVLIDLEKHEPSGVKFKSQFFNNGSRLYTNDMVFGDNEQTNPFLLLSVDAEKYMTQVVCSHPPDPSKATIAYLITYRRVGVSLSEETIDKLRDDMRNAIDLQDLGHIMSYGTSCEAQNS